MTDERPIGLFDSGVGGLSILVEIGRTLPHEDCLYFADSAHCPYGLRPAEDIRRLSTAIVRFLLGQGAKAIVVACNTASAAALHHLRAHFDVPIVGMVPAVKPASALTSSRVIGVLATRGTMEGQLFGEVVQRFADGVTVLTRVDNGLVELIEQGIVDGPEIEAILRRHLEPLVEAGMDTLVLGCTHYPFLIPAIRRLVGEVVTIVEAGPAVARQTACVLAEKGLLNGQARPGRRRYFTSGDPGTFASVLEQLTDDRAVVEGPVELAFWSS